MMCFLSVQCAVAHLSSPLWFKFGTADKSVAGLMSAGATDEQREAQLDTSHSKQQFQGFHDSLASLVKTSATCVCCVKLLKGSIPKSHSFFIFHHNIDTRSCRGWLVMPAALCTKCLQELDADTDVVTW